MPRRKKNTAKANLLISLLVHGLAVALLMIFAAREGILGTKLKEIAVVIVPKEKPPEPPKEKPPEPEPKQEPPKMEEPVPTPQEAPKETPPPEPVKVAATPAPPVGGDMAPIAAPPPAVLPDFNFSDGAKVVGSGTNSPVDFYRNYVEYTLRSNWERPEGVADDNYSAEVEVRVDGDGNILGNTWKHGSGDKKWDDSVKKALASTRSMSRPPPKDFPPKFIVRFDVLPATEPVVQ